MKRRDRSIGFQRCQEFVAPLPASRSYRYHPAMRATSSNLHGAFRCLWLLPLLALPLFAGAVEEPPDPATPGLAPGARVKALIDRIKYEQKHLRTIEASFVQRKESLLLVAPEESQGTFAYQAPDRVRWDFSAPRDTVVIIRGNQMLTWYRDLGRAERMNVGRQADQVLQHMSAANSIDRLQQYFTLSAAFPRDDRPYRLELEPRFSRVAKRLKGMTIGFDRESFVPVMLEIVEPDGDATALQFEDIRINQAIPPERFELDLPADVEVQTIELG